MPSVFNPGKKNRNFGTRARGHGQDNDLVVPRSSRTDRRWAETLKRHHRIERSVRQRDVAFFVEETDAGFFHACSIDDVCAVLADVPRDDWRGLKTFVFRQPTRKQRIVSPAWGCMVYDADLGYPGGGAVRRGPAIFLEAVDPDQPVKWPFSLKPDESSELERLRADGHVVSTAGKHYTIRSSLNAVRSTQLYRTLLHEIGHWVDYVQKVEEPHSRGGDIKSLASLYFARPQAEREAFAHRYAEEMREHLDKFGVIPFERL